MDIYNFVMYIGPVANFIVVVTAIFGGFAYLSSMKSQLDRLSADVNRLSADLNKLSADVAESKVDMKNMMADIAEVKSYTKFSDSQSNQIRDLQKENRKTSEELIKVKIAVENMGAQTPR